MANQNTLPLYDKYWVKHTLSRVMDSLTLLLLLLLLGYRINIFSHSNYTFPCLVAFICESWFTFSWILVISTKWSPAYTKTYIHRLLLRYISLLYLPLKKCLMKSLCCKTLGEKKRKYKYNRIYNMIGRETLTENKKY